MGIFLFTSVGRLWVNGGLGQRRPQPWPQRVGRLSTLLLPTTEVDQEGENIVPSLGQGQVCSYYPVLPTGTEPLSF